MIDHTPDPSLDRSADELPPVTPARMSFYADYQPSPQAHLACYLGLGATIYAAIVASVLIPYYAFEKVMGPGEFITGLLSLFALIIVGVFGAVAIGIVVIVVVAVAAPLVMLVLRVRRSEVRWEMAGCLAGSLTALAINAAYLLSATSGQGRFSISLPWLLLGIPCLQIAGAYAGLTNQRDIDRLRRTGARPRLGFSVGQLLLLMVVVSPLLAALKAASLLTTDLFVLLGIWLVWQSITQYPARRLARWRHNAAARRYHDALDRLEQARHAAPAS